MAWSFPRLTQRYSTRNCWTIHGKIVFLKIHVNLFILVPWIYMQHQVFLNAVCFATCYPRVGNSSLFKAKLSPLLSLSARPPNPPRPLPRPPRPPLSPLPPRPPRPPLRVSVEPLNSIGISTICFTRPDVLIFSSMTLKGAKCKSSSGLCSKTNWTVVASNRTQGDPVLWTCEIQGTQHKICTKKPQIS